MILPAARRLPYPPGPAAGPLGPPPVLLVGNFLSGALGTRTVGEDLAAALVAAGWPVITTSGQRHRLARLADMVRTVWRRRRDYRVAQVDVYSGPAFIWAEVVCWTLRRAGKPYILTLHGGNLPAFSRRWPGRVGRLLTSAARVTSPSRYLHEQLRAYRADVQLLPNPLDLGAYPYRCREHPAPRLVWLRSFHQIYNPLLAPQLLAQLVDEFPTISLAMVGPDTGDGSLQRVQDGARALGVTAQLHLVGAVTKAQVPAALNRGDIFVNTTNVDNTPISILEALACGLCVVSTNVGGIPHLLTDAQDALLVPPADAPRMAAAVRRILREPGLAARLSAQGRATAEQFDWASILPQWEALLHTVDGLAGPPR